AGSCAPMRWIITMVRNESLRTATRDKIRRQFPPPLRFGAASRAFPPSPCFRLHRVWTGQVGATRRDLGLLVDTLAPARSALADLWLRPNSFRRFPNGSSHLGRGGWRLP